ncbi:MAG TPA: cation-translocating P-type ATPase [Chitinophagaceae bacterium]
MSGNVIQIENLRGLSQQQVPSLQKQFGKNELHIEGSRRILHIIIDIVKEPMFLLLVVGCTLYFILGQVNEGFMLLVAMLFVAAISAYQDARSTSALRTLKQYAEPKITVIRDENAITIAAEELVPGDIMILEEGNKIPADAIVLQENDLTVNESVITGETFPVEKHETTGNNNLYQGSVINSGKCYAQVTATGPATVLGKLGKVSSAYSSTRTLLQQQVRSSVRRLTIFGITAFVLIWALNYLRSGSFTGSLMLGLTLAMAAIPEEIPVAFSSFMALGAYHLARLGIITRQPQTIENLGAVNVICLDKTGTITENKMEVKLLYDYKTDTLINLEESKSADHSQVLRFAMLASESDPFDAMEKAIHQAYQTYEPDSFPRLKLVYEYNLQGTPPMMTHVYRDNDSMIVSAKGAVEKIAVISKLEQNDLTRITGQVKSMAANGYRVIAVSSAVHLSKEMPARQEDFSWQFEGLLALYDPPKKNITQVFEKLYDARIEIKLLTGDYPETAMSIANQVGMRDSAVQVTGEQVMLMEPAELNETIKKVNVFTRMFPDAKLKVIESLKAGGQVVAMTGDGVNDGPALRSADIGIAMGQKGTEVARYAADLVLTDDDLEKMVEAIRHGRKIFNNLKKAIRYIISIHVPIIITAALPVVMGWQYPNIFTPIHVIFLELIMGPTCSVFFEREPVEANIMTRPPRARTEGLLTGEELMISVVQGIMIAMGVLILYYIFMTNQESLEKTRAVVFTTLVISNIFLTFANRSFRENFLKTIHYKNNLAPWIVLLSIALLVVIHSVPFLREIFGFAVLSAGEIALCAGVAFASVMWFEGYKTHLSSIR